MEHRIKRFKKDEVICGLCGSDENDLILVDDTNLKLGLNTMKYGE
jgi:hypothetical protein